MKKIVKIVVILSIIVLGMSTIRVFAETKNELSNMQNDIDSKIDQANNELNDVKHQMTEELNKIADLNEKIQNYENDIYSLEKRVSDINNQISEKTENLKIEEEKYKEQSELLEKRLVAIYESGDSSYLDMLLSSESISDFISNYFLVSELATYNEELIDKILERKEIIENEKNYLESAKKEVEETKASIAANKSQLNNTVNEKNNIVSGLSEEEKALNEQIEEYEKEKRVIRDKINKILEEEKNKGNVQISSPSQAGYIFPVAGLSQANINNKKYPSYRGHTGVDININASGKTVVAVKSGTVVTSKAAKRNGVYVSYGEYIIVNHHDGTMTLYAHMQPGSRTVTEGAEVSQRTSFRNCRKHRKLYRTTFAFRSIS